MNVITVFGFILLPILTTSESTDYCTLSCLTRTGFTRPGRHLLCATFKHDKTCPNKTVIALRPLERLTMLKEHNQLRNSLALGLETRGNPGPQPRLAGMMALRWDIELEDVAKQLIVECHFDSPSWCMDVPRFEVGVNWFQDKISSNGVKDVLTDGVKVWASQVDYLPNNLTTQLDATSEERTPAYVQMVAPRTSAIGCATATAVVPPTKDCAQNQTMVYLTCVYGPKRHSEDKPLYVQGSSCGTCPLKSHCSIQWPGLCQYPLDVTLPLRNAQDAIYTGPQCTQNSGSTVLNIGGLLVTIFGVVILSL